MTEDIVAWIDVFYEVRQNEEAKKQEGNKGAERAWDGLKLLLLVVGQGDGLGVPVKLVHELLEVELVLGGGLLPAVLLSEA